MTSNVKHALKSAGWFQEFGAYVLVDGQYGSTGKGLVAGMLAEMFHEDVAYVTTNAGPNSGHTSYFGDEKIVLCQLPTFGVIARKMGSEPTMTMNAGAIIEPQRLDAEVEQYVRDSFGLFVHPTAAVVRSGDKESEATLVNSVGSTGKGTGAALAAKVLRDPQAVYGGNEGMGQCLGGMPLGIAEDATVFVEVSQGFSLSLNAGGMYPFCTSRDCTVGQALSDANIHPSYLRQTMMVIRTFPIRVAGNSGPCFPDQEELTWDQLGQEAEITTVTKKIRRVFTFSMAQFRAAVVTNRPDHLFLNFMNYLEKDRQEAFIQDVVENYTRVMNRPPLTVMLGYGPKSSDVLLWEGTE